MKKALNGLSSLRHVAVTRAANAQTGTATHYDWSVTFIGECPACEGKKLVPNVDGLTSNGTAGGSIAVTQGLETNGGSSSTGGVVVQTTASVTLNGGTVVLNQPIAKGEYVRIASSFSALGETFKAADSKSAGDPLMLHDHRDMPATFRGNTNGAATCWIGTTPTGALAANLKSQVISDVADGSPFSFVATSLTPGVMYSAQVSAYNDRGYNEPRVSLPNWLAPPLQKPDVPTQVTLLVNTASSLKVLWNHPASSGGDMIIKYKVEWDSKASFSSGPGGAALSRQDVLLATPSTDCKVTPCEYIISSLSKGTSYFVRVFAYNK